MKAMRRKTAIARRNEIEEPWSDEDLRKREHEEANMSTNRFSQRVPTAFFRTDMQTQRCEDCNDATVGNLNFKVQQTHTTQAKVRCDIRKFKNPKVQKH